MAAAHEILNLLSRADLLAIAERFEVSLPERRRRAVIIDELVPALQDRLEEALLTLPRETLKKLCRELDLDQRGREKAILVARLVDGDVNAGDATISAPRRGTDAQDTETGPMWRRVTIDNYRSIERVEVELAPFSVVVGPNGSGKSNFADAFVFARDVAIDAATAVERRDGISALRRWDPSHSLDLTIGIRTASSRAGLDTDYVKHHFTISSGRDGSWHFTSEVIDIVEGGERMTHIHRSRNNIGFGPAVFDRHPGSAQSGFPISKPTDTASAMVVIRQLRDFHRVSALHTVTRIRPIPNVMRLPQSAADSSRLDESGSNIADAYRSLGRAAQDQVLAAMKKIVPGLTNIAVESFDRFLLLKFQQRQANGRTARFSASEMSEGALRALGILVAAQQMTHDELLIIEEPEVSIHVGAAQLLFDVLKEASLRGAVLVTTHSADLLDAAREEAILVCSYRDGISRIGPLASSQREVVREGLFSVAELMRSEPLRIEGEEPAAAEP